MRGRDCGKKREKPIVTEKGGATPATEDESAARKNLYTTLKRVLIPNERKEKR